MLAKFGGFLYRRRIVAPFGMFNWWAPAPLRWLWQCIGLKETPAKLAPAFHAQENLAAIDYEMRNKILTGRQYSTKHYEGMKEPLSLRDFGLSKLDTVYYSTAMSNNPTNHHFKDNQEEMADKLYTIWQKRLNSYTDKVAALQSELENTRADFGLHMDAYSARLQELSRVISSELQASVTALDVREAS